MVTTALKEKLLSPLAVRMGISLVLLVTSLSARPATEPELAGKADCEKLYSHQLFIMQSSLNPIATALKANSAQLNSVQTRAAQLNNCQKSVTLENLGCQLDALTPMELLRCQESFGLKAAAQPTASGSANGQPTDGSVTVTQQSEKDLRRAVKLNANNCKTTYEHLLAIYSASDLLPEGAEGQRLLKQWRSKEARASFEKRCIKDFEIEDVKCIQGASEPVTIQACLINVPPPEPKGRE